MREFGLEAFCHKVEDFDPAMVLEQVGILTNMKEPPVRKLHERTSEYRKSLASQFDRIIEMSRAGEG
jgi:hypothetical protein